MRRGIANLRGLDLNELQNALYDRLCYGIMAVSALVIVVKQDLVVLSTWILYVLGSQRHLYLFMQSISNRPH